MHAHFLGSGQLIGSHCLPTSYRSGLPVRSASRSPSTVGRMSPTQPAASPEHVATSATSGVSADHPGVNELFALLAYGEVAAFYRLTDEARMAPNLLRPDQHGQHGRRRDGPLRVAARRAGPPGHRRRPGDDEIRPGAGELPPADHAEHLAGGAGEDLRRRRAGRRLLPGDRRRAARRGRRRGARGAGRNGSLTVRRRRGARRGHRQPASSGTGWRCGRAGCSARPSPRPSSCWPTTTSWSTWSCRAPTGSAS